MSQRDAPGRCTRAQRFAAYLADTLRERWEMQLFKYTPRDHAGPPCAPIARVLVASFCRETDLRAQQGGRVVLDQLGERSEGGYDLSTKSKDVREKLGGNTANVCQSRGTALRRSFFLLKLGHTVGTAPERGISALRPKFRHSPGAAATVHIPSRGHADCVSRCTPPPQTSLSGTSFPVGYSRARRL